MCAGKGEKVKGKWEQRGDKQGLGGGGDVPLRHSKSKKDGVKAYPLAGALRVALACLLIS